MSDLTALQLELLERMATLDPPPCVIGGYAEDALVGGTVSRPHEDVDWLVPRSELSHRLDQARALGFTDFETWGESAPGFPFYLYAKQGALSIDIGVSDEADGHPVVDVHRLAFTIDDGKEPPVGYRLHLPADTYSHEAVMLDDVRVWPASPLACYQLRAGIASKGSFGAMGEKQLTSLRRLKEAFYPDETEDDLLPRIEPLEGVA